MFWSKTRFETFLISTSQFADKLMPNTFVRFYKRCKILSPCIQLSQQVQLRYLFIIQKWLNLQCLIAPFNERVERIHFLSFISLPDCCLVAVFFCLKMLTISKLEIQLQLWRRSLSDALSFVLMLALSLSVLPIIWTGNTDRCLFKHQFNDLMHLIPFNVW